MEVLWAPWRMEYILGDKERGCVFCSRLKQDDDRRNLVLHRSKRAFVIMNRYPYNNGHVMVVPNRHISNLEEQSEEEALDMARLLNRSIEIIKAKMNAEGLNLGMNLGRVGGAGIEEHIHYHLVPRWLGDSSFMAAVGETRVIPQHLMETYDLLKPGYGEE